MRDHLILAGTFHKTGTVLIGRVFRGIAKALSLRFHEGPAEGATPGSFEIGFEPRARFAELAGDRPFRAVVCIRDPRDVVISAAHYHCRSTEAWLHAPQEALEGRSYQQHLLSLPDDEQRYLFELRRSAKRTVRGMLAFAEPPSNICVTRMEALVVDTELVEFRRIFEFLGFTESELPACLDMARKFSLFGRTEATPSVHVRSGGEAEQWRKAFTPKVMRAWMRLYPDAAERLGYPPSELPRPPRKPRPAAAVDGPAA